MTAIFYNQQEQTPTNTRPIPVASHHAGDQIITHEADTYSFEITQHFCIQLIYSVDIATKLFQSHRAHTPPNAVFFLFNFVRIVDKQAIIGQMFLYEIPLNFCDYRSKFLASQVSFILQNTSPYLDFFGLNRQILFQAETTSGQKGKVSSLKFSTFVL